MVKKEQIQKELEMCKQENKALQKHIGELTAENEELKKQLEEAKTAAAENANYDGSSFAKATEDKRDGQDGRAGTEAAAHDQTDELKGKIGILLGAIADSCKDHCPHHLNQDACKNCNIRKSVFNAGFDMPKPMTETEKE